MRSRRKLYITGFGNSAIRWHRTLHRNWFSVEFVPFQADMLQIKYWGAELKLPAGLEMDTVAALLRSLQSL